MRDILSKLTTYILVFLFVFIMFMPPFMVFEFAIECTTSIILAFIGSGAILTLEIVFLFAIIDAAKIAGREERDSEDAYGRKE